MNTLPAFGRRGFAGVPAAAPTPAAEGPGACHACWRPMQPGEALLVVPTDDRPEYVVHRVGGSHSCFAAASRRSLTTITLYDQHAAREYDRAHGTDALRRAEADARAIHARREGGA